MGPEGMMMGVEEVSICKSLMKYVLSSMRHHGLSERLFEESPRPKRFKESIISGAYKKNVPSI